MKLTKGNFIELAKVVDKIHADISEHLKRRVETANTNDIQDISFRFGCADMAIEARHAVLERVVKLCRSSSPGFDENRFREYVKKLAEESQENG